MTSRTQPISELLGTAAAQAAPVVRGIADDSFAAPTPCSEYDVRALLNHLFQIVVNFQALAAKQPADFASNPDYLADADWRTRFDAETAKLVAAWAAPGAEEGVSAGMGLPARTVGSMVLLDLTVHIWDLTQATGRSFEPDPAVVENLAELVEQMAPTARKMNVFGEEVEPPEGASAFERLLAATGRNPRDWAAAVD
ncbi:TIGR03086 family metal-binding protein [Streptomyces sp. NBC_01353]|uniref:TIGR03086 family metal-binding protein n=1 Tax=Streptomyces sp. NBC_01353 TaxID=2903835 RepID=UPI002E3288FF|nr:TIGR03086 family metal-binding protein [Streptomyces sp. NBC_01353]